MSSINIREELNRFRDRLLDLSNANRLLNYRKTKTRSVQIVHARLDHIMQRLVQQGKSFRFQWIEEPELRGGRSPRASQQRGLPFPSFDQFKETKELGTDDVSGESLPSVEREGDQPRLDNPEQAPLPVKQRDDTLQTDRTEAGLERVLTTIRRAANNAVEETGVNYLYIALGMLDWNERAKAASRLLSPLILVPVKLQREFDNRRHRYETTLHYTGDEIQTNLCLGRRLQRDFGIVIPSLVDETDEEPTTPRKYLAQVSDAIAGQPEWKVHDEAVVGFFMFNKLFMYLDLDMNAWTDELSPENNELVRAVIEGSQIEEDASIGGYAPDYPIDEHPGAQRIQLVKDADSSQHSALCDIADGKSLVIEGPPGTGKSQTITNAIADALHRGQRILFVAEKLAALEVVKSNLNSAGLGQFCLELHSDAATPQRVMDELRRRLDFTPRRPGDIQAVRTRLQDRRKRLGRYLERMAQPLGPHQLPAYDVLWRVAATQQANGRKPIGEITIPWDVDAAGFDAACTAIKELAIHLRELQPVNELPWRGLNADRLVPSKTHLVSKWLEDLRRLASAAEVNLQKLVSEFGDSEEIWLKRIIAGQNDQLEEARAEWLDGVPENVARWLVEFAIPKRRELAAVMLQEIEEANTVRSQARSVLVVDPEQGLTASVALVSAMDILGEAGVLTTPVSGLLEMRVQWLAATTCLEHVMRLGKQLETLGFGPIHTLQHFREAVELYRMMIHPAVESVPPPAWAFSQNAAQLLQRGQQETSTLKSLRTEIEERVFMHKIPARETIEELIDVFATIGKSWFRTFQSRYRWARRTMKEFTKAAHGRRNARQDLRLLEKLLDFHSRSERFPHHAELKQALGDQFSGEETNWERLDTLARWARQAKRMGMGYQECSECHRHVHAAPKMTNRELLDACKQFQRGWEHPVCAALVGGSDLSGIPLAPLRARAQQWIDAAAVVLEHRRAFRAVDDKPVGHLLELARLQIEASQSEQALSNGLYGKAFPDLFQGVATDLQGPQSAGRLYEALAPLQLSPDCTTRLVRDADGMLMRELCGRMADSRVVLGQWNVVLDKLRELGSKPSTWLKLPGPSKDLFHRHRIESAQQRFSSITAWAGYCRAVARCDKLGLAKFVRRLEQGTIPLDTAVEVYDLTLHHHLIERFLEDSNLLRDTSRQRLETARREFTQLDEELIELQRQELACQLIRHPVPPGNAKGRVGELTELALIRHETSKQQRHCRIRDLIQRAGRAVLALKPCFMMSPLSIAQYLAPGSVEFDLVVMDEASQIKPEDALGTLLRARQMVVVGDPKQLPPTSFFDRLGGAEEENDGEETFLDNTESVLEVALKTFPARRRLRWHYRSQHESLIAFSNEKFYDGELVIFPSPSSERGRLGVFLRHVPDAFFSGGCNAVEADVVAQAIVEHARQHGGESLGIAAFNAAQARAIQDRLEAICVQDDDARNAVAALEQHNEPLFIKNLESVQGDERDVIFISYTYGPSPETGRCFNRFGPMAGIHGWRRLNVLITRAKRRVIVFSSMHPSDIVSGPDRSRGVNAMKQYLEFAQTGRLGERETSSGRGPESPFEITVSRIVESLGLRVVPQVGVAGFFIDLGVLAPGSDDQFLLGIECDGATYHSSKSSRDRDRLREQVIRSRGWNLHRVWSTDWFLNREAEEQRLRKAILAQVESCERSCRTLTSNG
ncbi:MAG: DUF4011 domain-containing protein [Pirellulaceae bacterium]|nr:DUF4011 domain-containing protein [Pirellulaceae bacterium]